MADSSNLAIRPFLVETFRMDAIKSQSSFLSV